MKMFHRPLMFWLGCLLITAGVFAHAPMFLMGRHTHWQMVNMPMTPVMWIGMALIPVGLAIAWIGLIPPATESGARRASGQWFHVAADVPLNAEHLKLVTVLVVTLAIDVMKPATLGFVMPGMSREYQIGRSQAGLLALTALTGTTLGSLVWGRIADQIGRRAAILLSALMFMGTSICGAMPSFGWNLAMCFLMGLSAGGLLPITFTLMAEAIPARHRGWLLVALSGIGTSADYLLAAVSAAVLEPMMSWRVLWLLGLPTGAIILMLNRYIPESPRFLWATGRTQQALQVLRRFSDGRTELEPDDVQHPAPPAIDETHPVVSARQLLKGRYAPLTLALLTCGVGWGLVNFGFLLWLPSNLAALGIDAAATSGLLAKSAVYAIPGIALVVWLYHRYSTFLTLAGFITATAVVLLVFAVLGHSGVASPFTTVLATAALLVAVSAVIAMLIPYAAEIYPVHLRGTGSGLIAASSKFGGILGAGIALLGFFDQFTTSALALAGPMAFAASLLLVRGVETRGESLERIQANLSA